MGATDTPGDAGRTYDFGIVGAGSIATVHAEAISQIARARLVGVTAIPVDAARELAERYGARAYDSVDDLLAEQDIDIVTLGTPSGLHSDQAIAAMEAGKHVIVEKPLAITAEGADAAVAASERTGLRLAVVCQRRFEPAAIALKKAIDDGVLGRIVFVSGRVHYFREASYYAGSGWRGTWSMDGGGALMNQGVHTVDLMCWFGGPVHSVYASARTLLHQIEVEDTLAASIEFESGALGTIEATTCAYPGRTMRVEVTGDKGTAVIEGSRIVYWNTSDGRECPVDPSSGSTASGASNPMGISCTGHRIQFEDLIAALDTGRPPAIDGNEGRKAVRVILAAYASSSTGQRVHLAEPAP